MEVSDCEGGGLISMMEMGEKLKRADFGEKNLFFLYSEIAFD